ncbi:E3 ubiquitin-protein ligase DTX3L-like [Mercenaria mercenaria]|uniref:E3 ubiquitin-protein ligase DTX3L-like n=1 Tax=Mercenaria mercenaria TaxID=6596 RepID=UPI00234E40DA|nr:E3 ubiquitin-protein ligase DTX3L-like [Mercenaria mercenaria]
MCLAKKVSRTERQTENFGNYKTESTKSEEMLNKDQSYHDESDEDSDKDDNNREEDAETCVICMEDITDPQKLSCGHVFCADCIKEQFTYKQACPTCGKVCGIIKGDQPYGRMDVVINDRASCAGFESSGRIEITYKFPDGTQEDNHPCPGQRYKGITRTAYLPNNRKGREICDMLKVAFKRKLVFTIGRSRTTGADGVITWNDIHHKTDPKPHSQFGYPDPTYLDRVTEELEVKGVTVKDIPADHATRPRRR